MKKHKLTFLATSILMGLIPLLVAAVTISTVAIYKTKSNLEERVYLQLQACAISVRECFEWDINEEILEVDEVSLDFIDSLTVQDIDLTLFLEDVRFITSIYNENGERNVGTKASEANTASCQETTASIEELRKNIEMINIQATDTNNISEELKESVAYFKL